MTEEEWTADTGSGFFIYGPRSEYTRLAESLSGINLYVRPCMETTARMTVCNEEKDVCIEWYTVASR